MGKWGGAGFGWCCFLAQQQKVCRNVCVFYFYRLHAGLAVVMESLALLVVVVVVVVEEVVVEVGGVGVDSGGNPWHLLHPPPPSHRSKVHNHPL